MRELREWFFPFDHQCVIGGFVFKDTRYPDGHEIITSKIKRAYERGNNTHVIHSQSNRYVLIGKSDKKSNRRLQEIVKKTSEAVARGADGGWPPGMDCRTEATTGTDAATDGLTPDELAAEDVAKRLDDQSLLEGINDPE